MLCIWPTVSYSSRTAPVSPAAEGEPPQYGVPYSCGLVELFLDVLIVIWITGKHNTCHKQVKLSTTCNGSFFRSAVHMYRALEFFVGATMHSVLVVLYVMSCLGKHLVCAIRSWPTSSDGAMRIMSSA